MTRHWRTHPAMSAVLSPHEARIAYDRLLTPALYAPGDGVVLLGLSVVALGCLGMLGMSVVLLARCC